MWYTTVPHLLANIIQLPWVILMLATAHGSTSNLLMGAVSMTMIPVIAVLAAAFAIYLCLASLSLTKWNSKVRPRQPARRWLPSGPVQSNFEIQTRMLRNHVFDSVSPLSLSWIPQLAGRMAALALAFYFVAGAAIIGLHEPTSSAVDLYCSSALGMTGQTLRGNSYSTCARILAARSTRADPQAGPDLLLIIDSGASFHIHNQQSDLVNVRPCSDTFEGVDRVRHQASCIGDLNLECNDYDGNTLSLTLGDVRIFPKISDSLISVSQLWDQHRVQVLFGSENAIVLNSQRNGTGLNVPIVKRNGVFEWHTRAIARLGRNKRCTKSRTASCPRACFGNKSAIRSTKSTSYFNDYSADIAAHHMHLRLHAGIHRLRKLPSITADAPPSLSRAGNVRCEHCAIANSTRLAHTCSAYKPSYPGRLIHADIAGDFNATKIGHYQWLLILVDDHTRFKFAYPLQHRRDAPSQMRKFVASFNSMARGAQADGRIVRTIGSLLNDKAGEFVSKEFKDFLAGNLIDQKLVPAEVKPLNGVAERAVRTIMEQTRSLMVASNAPKGFWNFAVAQAVDILNRTTCPPNSEVSSYEMLSGERPRILSILPFGCRMYAVRVKQGNKKFTQYPRAFDGINLGRSTETQGSYCVWIPEHHKVVTTSEVYHDETLMPWRPAGSQRIADPAPLPADADADQPVTIPIGADPGAPAAPANSLAEEFKRLAASEDPLQSWHDGSKAPPASISRHVLILFSGPKDRPDGLMTFLRRLGFSVTALDNDPKNGGGKDDDILSDVVYEKLLRNAQRGEYFGILAAPPCSTFSVARHIRSTQSSDGGPPPVRSRKQIQGIKGIPASHRRELSRANMIIVRTASILSAAAGSGSEFIIENPADRGDPSDEKLFIDENHGPLWLLPEIMGLEDAWTCRKVTFPQCAFGAPVLKYTTLMYTPGLDKTLGDFNKLECTHTSHADRAGGSRRSDGTWNSADKAAYPANMNLALAQCFAVAAGTHRKDAFNLPLPADPAAGTDPLPQATQGSQERGGTNQSAPTPSVDEMHPANDTRTPETDGEIQVHDDQPADQLDPADFLDVEPEVEAGESEASTPSRWTGRLRTGDNARSKYMNQGLREGSSLREGRVLLAVGPNHSLAIDSAAPDSGSIKGLPDPKNRREAMAAPDKDGWLNAESGELSNHQRNGSFQVISRTAFRKEAPGRKLVRLTWAYKRKRSGSLKARLCVQGCSQIPGVDYDQTFCGAMRATSLRLLAALSSQLDLMMRRYDFVSAFLQGDLEKGEVIFCECPPGYDEPGPDGMPQVYKVLKPVYGMAQAGRRWQRSLFPWLMDSSPETGNLTQSESDPSVFFCRKEVKTPQGPRQETLIVGVYVDDLFILYSHSDKHSLYHRFLGALTKRWDVEDEGEVSDLLNVEMTRTAGGHVTLRQSVYIDRLVAIHAPDGVPTNSQRNKIPCDPALPQLVLDAVDSDSIPDADTRSKYMSLVGALLYCATHTRPDIAYAVSLLSRAMHCPTKDLYDAALRVLYYLYRTRMYGLRYSPNDKVGFHGMSDSDWAVKHSTSGSVFMLSGAAISWASKRQVTIALSSCEAEIMAASEAAKEAIYLGSFLKELGVLPADQPSRLALDNTAARDLAYNPQHHDRTKHIARRHFFIREMVENGRLVVPYVRSIDNLADFFTKPLPASVFFAMRDKIMNIKEDFPPLE